MFSFRSSQQLLGYFLFGASNAGQTLRTHFRIVGTLVIVGVHNDQNLIVIAVQESDSTPGSEDIVIGMRRKNENCFIVKFFKARFLRVSQDQSETDDSQDDDQPSHAAVSHGSFNPAAITIAQR